MKNKDALQTEIRYLTKEKTHLQDRLEKALDESVKLFLESLINYNEEAIANLIVLHDETTK